MPKAYSGPFPSCFQVDHFSSVWWIFPLEVLTHRLVFWQHHPLQLNMPLPQESEMGWSSPHLPMPHPDQDSITRHPALLFLALSHSCCPFPSFMKSGYAVSSTLSPPSSSQASASTRMAQPVTSAQSMTHFQVDQNAPPWFKKWQVCINPLSSASWQVAQVAVPMATAAALRNWGMVRRWERPLLFHWISATLFFVKYSLGSWEFHIRFQSSKKLILLIFVSVCLFQWRNQLCKAPFHHFLWSHTSSQTSFICSLIQCYTTVDQCQSELLPVRVKMS